MMVRKTVTNFALDPDEKALEQFKDCYSQPYVVGASLMPDAHKGYVAPIGAVLVTKGFVVPSWVGYDIGCGMTVVRLPKSSLNLLKKNARKIYQGVLKKVPMGLGVINSSEKNVSSETCKAYEKLISKFRKGAHNKQVLQFLETGKALKNLGSLGHGNHFISLNVGEDGFPWIVVHSGSRAVGHWAAKFYMKKSSGDEKEFEVTGPLDVSSDLGKEYLNLLDFGLEFAKLNRLEIVKSVVSVIESVLGKKVRASVWANKNHNHVVLEKGVYVHRKGATPAKKGERGIIPANMRDGSFLVEGKGSRDFVSSSSHGAGRKMSRREARESIDQKEFEKEMVGCGVVGNFSDSALDEAPGAYKDIKSVLDMQKKSIRVVNHLVPFINWQGEGRHRG